MATNVFNRAVAILNEYILKCKDGMQNPLKFACDAMSLYQINADEENIQGFSESLFRTTIEEILAIEEEKLDQENDIIHSSPVLHVEEPFKQITRQRRGSVSASGNPFAPINEYPKSKEVFSFLLEILRNTRLIAQTMDLDQMKQLVSTMYLEEITEGKQLITQGEYGKTMYLIESGEFIIVQHGSPVSIMYANSLFGEISLLYSFPRTASVICRKDARVWVAHSDSYTAILMSKQRANREMISQVLEKNKRYAELSVEKKDRVLRTTHLMHFSPDDTLELSEEGVFMVLSPSALLVPKHQTEEKKYMQGEILYKGALCKTHMALLFIPENVAPSLGIPLYDQNFSL
ncbi:cAMP-dependent protein kinase regulator [Nematocida sp. LUAm3]|nr:cAMP-dependent protein kinase regulator [Nematocida sp. LUAm3]KAI5175333.1 cAMP-dependent protein kinase regulator [Nematocida sp. LUAm2]KAI5177710.1 cAMP-dependent protein kinase regulator [Nematocida sp. LUAm1]